MMGERIASGGISLQGWHTGERERERVVEENAERAERAERKRERRNEKRSRRREKGL